LAQWYSLDVLTFLKQHRIKGARKTAAIVLLTP
jgi:hypothetical protein